MPEVRKCSTCGAELPNESARGQCVQCLLRFGLGLDQGSDLTSLIEPSATDVLAAVIDKPGDRIGHYLLLEKIGEGGCGVVYMADQEEPVRRRVALKVIKLGMDTKQVIARFEAERQALALMDHPNIAKVFDGGATETGRPFFVMELVKGIPITRYCDENKHNTRQRLGLFMQVCQAIEHAHQKGIIHRDIKPSNILVTDYDGGPVSKVIDFGIAKATVGQTLTDKTLFTAFEQFIGTPSYMSPEQARLSGMDIDKRSDIYSLGVLLYELLTGKTPFDSKRLFEAGFDEIRRIIREEEPPRPSTRLTGFTNEELTTVAKRRNADPPGLIHLVRGDLDWIVMKCLEKDRTRRYDTANTLALDLTRHLNNEPIAARPPSIAYKIRKYVRRNRVALGLAATLLFLATALLVSTLLLVKEFQAGKSTSITVNSNPKGAEVWHDGQMLGTTPIEVTGLLPGAFTYTLVLTNCETVTNTTTLGSKKHMNDFTFLRQIEPRQTATTAGLSTKAALSTNVAVSATITERMTATAPSGEVTLVSVQGMVQVARNESKQWLPATASTVLFDRDRLRTGRNSRATLRFSDQSILRVNELTELQIRPASANRLEEPSLKMENGTIHFFNRGTNSPTIRTPSVKVGVRG